MNLVKTIKLNWAIILIILLAFSLRLIMILKSGPFFFDEMFSFMFSQKSWGTSWQYWLWETNPPLHLFFEKVWFYLFPANEFWARIPSAIFGTASVFVTFLLGKKLFNQKVGILASILLATTPYQIFQSGINRTYSLTILLTLISIYCFFLIFFYNQNTNKNRIIYIIINILLLLSHLTAVFIISSQLLLVIWQNKSYKQWLKINILPIFLWLVWFINSLIYKFNTDTFTGAWFFNTKHHFSNYIANFQLLLTTPGSQIIGIIYISLFILTLSYTLYSQYKKNIIDNNLLYLLLISLLPIITAICLKIINIKFFVIITPLIVLILAYNLCYATKNKIIKILVIITNIICCLYLIVNFAPTNNWRQFNEIIARQYNPNKQQIIIYNNYLYRDLFARYYDGDIITKPYYNYPMDYDEAIVKNNYKLLTEDTEKIDNWFQKNKLDKYNQIILFYHRQRQIDLPTILIKNGYTIQSSQQLYNDDQPIIMIYEKN